MDWLCGIYLEYNVNVKMTYRPLKIYLSLFSIYKIEEYKLPKPNRLNYEFLKVTTLWLHIFQDNCPFFPEFIVFINNYMSFERYEYFIIVPHLFTICEWKLVILDGLDLCVYPTVAAMSSCEPQVWELRLVEDTPVLVEEGPLLTSFYSAIDQVCNPPPPPHS